jgi:hypothetical protein
MGLKSPTLANDSMMTREVRLCGSSLASEERAAKQIWHRGEGILA